MERVSGMMVYRFVSNINCPHIHIHQWHCTFGSPGICLDICTPTHWYVYICTMCVGDANMDIWIILQRNPARIFVLLLFTSVFIQLFLPRFFPSFSFSLLTFYSTVLLQHLSKILPPSLLIASKAAQREFTNPLSFSHSLLSCSRRTIADDVDLKF